MEVLWATLCGISYINFNPFRPKLRPNIVMNISANNYFSQKRIPANKIR